MLSELRFLHDDEANVAAQIFYLRNLKNYYCVVTSQLYCCQVDCRNSF